jgi:ATP adenylyltransferase
MRYISAPWRAAYVRKALKMTTCVFCEALKSRDDRKSAILFRGTHHFILLNKYPYTPGHLMIAPFRHLDDLSKARPAEAAEIGGLLRLAVRILRGRYTPHGFNVGMNLGHSAGAGVADHYHLHVIPRWTGDSNFMPLVGGTRVFIEDLDTTYNRLLPFFRKERARRDRADGPARRAHKK